MGAQQWVTSTVGLAATFGVIATLWQRQRSEHLDRRERASERVRLREQQARHDEQQARAEWWRRWEWAVELASADDPAREGAGAATMEALADSPLITASELGILEVFGRMSEWSSHGSD
ncbi:MAG: hypothetical protein QM809_15205 [Gordonia sp. (in: high G+C Gram-positive bacteria)]|uniref:hypothetical protein n=1 Tax=Gordonia sp. (in: high G+C Gram-positive bacteria) TaxID=84139 RepID=UPI0039E5BFE2